MSLTILKSGLLDTVQDRGRYGYAHLGINQNGAMDRLGMALANMLVGNASTEAVLEMHFPAAEILLEQDVLLSLAGADFDARTNGIRIPANTAVWLKAGAILRFQNAVAGARCYLAVQGGFDLEPWLGSCSTNLAAAAGGWQGRALHAGDKLPCRKKSACPVAIGDKNAMVLPFRVNMAGLLSAQRAIRFCPGPEFGWMDKGAKQQLEASEWLLSAQSDRMGYRLNGPTIQQTGNAQLLSSAVLPGTIQWLPNGQLIVLMADSQATGGYPRIGHVIQADLPKLAQLRPGAKVNFQEVPLDAAFAALQRQEQALRRLQAAIKHQLSCIST